MSAAVGEAPRSAAASSYCLPMEKSRPRTITTTKEMEKVTWPRIWAVVPVPTKVNRSVKTSRSATPMTISGVTSGKSMRKFELPDPRPCQRAKPIARSTPIGVAMTTSATASLRLWTSASRRVGSCQTESTGSPQYQRVEKPCQVVRERVALKENCTAISTGTIDQTTYPQVTRGRKRGRPHGFESQPRNRLHAEGRGATGASATELTSSVPAASTGGSSTGSSP